MAPSILSKFTSQPNNLENERMSKRNYIVLHKTEWNRLNRKIENEKANDRDEYFKTLIETSQNWQKTWPDTIEGHVARIAELKAKQHAEDVALVKSLRANKNLEDTANALTKARKIIFEESCYGKQLTSLSLTAILRQISANVAPTNVRLNLNSALLESRTLEEREAQIELRRKIRQEEKEREQEMLSKQKIEENKAETRHQDIQLQKKRCEKELANMNKLMYETKVRKIDKEKEEQRKLEQENAKQMQELLENEKNQVKAYEELLRKDMQEYEKKQIKIKKLKEEKAKKEDAIMTAQQKEFDKRYCKIRRITLEMHNKYLNETEQSKKEFQLLKKLQADEKARFDNLVHSGLRAMEKRIEIQDKNEAVKKKALRATNHAMAEANKKSAEMAKLMRGGKCSDRQCLIPKQERCRLKKITKNKIPTETKGEQLSFLSRPNSLLEELNQRKKAATPWSALEGAHAQFTENAALTLRECRHKIFAKRVVDNYRRLNCLDSTSLPVENY